MAHPGYACLLHCPQPRPILVVIAESSHRSNLVGAVRFVCRKLVVIEPRTGSPLSRGRTDVAHPAAAHTANRRRLIFLAWIWSSAGVLLRRARYARVPVLPQSRSWPFPARLGGAVPISSRRPTANTLAQTRGILRGMPPWRAPRGKQA